MDHELLDNLGAAVRQVEHLALVEHLHQRADLVGQVAEEVVDFLRNGHPFVLKPRLRVDALEFVNLSRSR